MKRMAAAAVVCLSFFTLALGRHVFRKKFASQEEERSSASDLPTAALASPPPSAIGGDDVDQREGSMGRAEGASRAPDTVQMVAVRTTSGFSKFMRSCWLNMNICFYPSALAASRYDHLIHRSTMVYELLFTFFQLLSLNK